MIQILAVKGSVNNEGGFDSVISNSVGCSVYKSQQGRVGLMTQRIPDKQTED